MSKSKKWMPFLRRTVLRTAILSSMSLLSFIAPTSLRAQTAPYLDSNGWTVFTPSSDTKIIYVSSSTGNDANSGLSASTPVKTIAKGLSMLRDGYPDWLLLKKGDVWTEANQPRGSGRSATEPWLISSYGTGPRPLIQTNSSLGGAFYIGAGGGVPVTAGNNIAFVGLELYAYDRDPSNPNFNAANVGIALTGIGYLNHITWALIEDCKISFFMENIAVDASTVFPTYGFDSNVTIRRNVIVNAYTVSTNGGDGIHLGGVNNALIEENVIDHNGYQAGLTVSGQYMFNHNIYISAYLVEYDTTTISNPIVLRGNIIAHDASGSQLRSGGTITNNLWVRNPYPYSIGFPTAFQSVISNDVYTEAASSPGQNLNWGPASGSFSTNYNMGTVNWQNNIVAHSSKDTSSNVFGIYLDNGYIGSITNNILYDWQAPLLVYPAGTTVSGNVQDAAGTNAEGYPDPTRTVGSYAGTLGLTATTDAFLAAARLQSKDNWNPRLMAAAVNSYIAAGFGFSSWPTTGTTTPAPTPPPTTTAVPPPVPTGLTGAPAASTQINLGWNASSNATGYKVFRNGNNVGVATTTSYQDTGLSTGTTYSYTVSAYDSAGSSAQSAPVTVSTPSAPVVTPSAPVVTITSPANGASIKGNGSVNIAASATDATGLKSITIQGDSTVLQTCLNATSCSVTWQGKAVTRGTHTITAIVVDAAGLQATASVSIVAAK